MWFALAVPVIAVGSVFAAELSSVSSDRAALQSAADAAALAAAKELVSSSMTAVAERAKSHAGLQLTDISARYAMTIDSTVSANPALVTVNITAHRDSFFGNLVPPGGFTLRVSSAASSMGTVPLCVLTHSIIPPGATKTGKAPPPASTGAGLLLEKDAILEAGACMVQSNDDLIVMDNAQLMAGLARAGGLISGSVTPAGEPGAPLLEDPFADLDLTIPKSCPANSATTMIVTGSQTLPAGLHCGGLWMGSNAVMTLPPGEHYFIGDVKIEENAQLTGTDVVLIFDKDSKFEFKGNSRISLEGRLSGALAGFVVMTTRKNDRDFHMNSARIEKLLGTVYIPAARLVIEGNQKVAQDSPWTVIVASQIAMRQSPRLVINARYAASNVPVPIGVGPNSGRTKLVR